MKRLPTILLLALICLLPFVSPYLFDQGERFAAAHPRSQIKFEINEHPKVRHAPVKDNSEQKIMAFNQQVEHYFNHLRFSDNAFYVSAAFLCLTIISLLAQPIIALLATAKRLPKAKKAQPSVSKKPKIAPYKRHLLD